MRGSVLQMLKEVAMAGSAGKEGGVEVATGAGSPSGRSALHRAAHGKRFNDEQKTATAALRFSDQDAGPGAAGSALAGKDSDGAGYRRVGQGGSYCRCGAYTAPKTCRAEHDSASMTLTAVRLPDVQSRYKISVTFPIARSTRRHPLTIALCTD